VIAGAINRLKHNTPIAAGRTSCVSNLQDAWRTSLMRRKEDPEIKIVSEDHKSDGSRTFEDLGVRSRRLTGRGPMNGLDSILDKKLDPRAGSDSCRSESSCHWKGQFNLFHPPGSVCERLANVFFLKVRICIENLCIRVPGRNQTNNRPDGNTYAAKAGFATHDFGIADDAV
jgi:hypothetical protein